MQNLGVRYLSPIVHTALVKAPSRTDWARSTLLGSGNKRALAAGFLNWRDRCRARGKAFLTEMQSISKSTPQQLTLRF
jgi:hypothetical protein